MSTNDTAGFVKYHTCGCMSMGSAGSGTVWENLTCGVAC